MFVKCFDNYADAKQSVFEHVRYNKRHPGLHGVEYRIYRRNGRYEIWRYRRVSDLPNYLREAPVY